MNNEEDFAKTAREMVENTGYNLKDFRPEKVQIHSNLLFSVYGKRRKTPNEFTKLSDQIIILKTEILQTLKIPQIVDWLSKRLK